MAFLSLAVYPLILALAVCVVAAPSRPLQLRQDGFEVLTPAQVASFKPFAYYANAGYCEPSELLTWTCGSNCQATPAFQPFAAGGDGSFTQYWFVGFDPTEKTVIVSHQGTTPAEIIPLITDIFIEKEQLNTTLFPGIDSSIEVHSGFADEHAKTALDVLSAVSLALSKTGASSVTVVGHSLGAALALLDGVFLPLHIPNVQFSVIGFGTPRVGNQAFADYVDAHVNLSRINNQEDPVPVLPGQILGFQQPSGEKHIQDDLTWIACPGQDNTDPRCSAGDLGLLNVNITNHDGPYDGIRMNTHCP